MKLYRVLQEIQNKTQTLRDEIHNLRIHERPGISGPSVIPIGESVFRNFSDTTLLEMILIQAREYRELKRERARHNEPLADRVEKYRDAITAELPEFEYLLKEEWELQ